MRAYGEAGYTAGKRNANSNAYALMENHGVRAKIEELRILEINDNREAARLNRNQKLQILEEIAQNRNEKAVSRILAIKVHNEMTGEAGLPPEPSKNVSEQERVEELRQRRDTVISALQRHRKPPEPARLASDPKSGSEARE